tara:strand:- start:1013 stop:1219 length:207 start_codon:yes stop_codon:yes gene_type:complete
MDKRKTKEELIENYDAAYSAAYSAAAYTAAYASADAAAADADSLEYYLSEYFTLTGESREEYQREADK